MTLAITSRAFSLDDRRPRRRIRESLFRHPRHRIGRHHVPRNLLQEGPKLGMDPVELPVAIVEVQSGGYLDEDDIERYDDAYGRR